MINNLKVRNNLSNDITLKNNWLVKIWLKRKHQFLISQALKYKYLLVYLDRFDLFEEKYLYFESLNKLNDILDFILLLTLNTKYLMALYDIDEDMEEQIYTLGIVVSLSKTHPLKEISES